MSAGPCYIHGFSGTQKKHRKSVHFKSTFKNKLVISTNKKEAFEIAQTRKERLERIKQDDLFKRLIFIPLIAGVFFILFFYFHFVGLPLFNSAIGREELSNYELRKIRKEKELETAFTYHLTNGHNNYYYDNFDAAQYDYQLALKINPSNYAANLGLSKTLMKKCILKGELCAEADEYEKMLDSVHQHHRQMMKNK